MPSREKWTAARARVRRRVPHGRSPKRWVAIAVSLYRDQLAWLDAQARQATRPERQPPNRSAVIQRLIDHAMKREEA